MAQKLLDKFDSESDSQHARKDNPELTAETFLDDTKKVIKDIKSK